MPADGDGLTLEANAASASAPPAPLKFKITSDDFSGTTSLDAAWQAKPFMTAVVKPIVLKLNKRPHKEPVASEYLEAVEIDGVKLSSKLDLKVATVAQVVPAGTERVALTFGLAPPKELKFNVCAGRDLVSNEELSFTITLDSKFLKKSFHDAVIVPFVHYYNKRAHLPVEAKQCVQVHIDGIKAPGSTGTMVHEKTALQFLGRSPAVVELFFSWEAVARAEKLANGGGRQRDFSRLQFKVPISKATDVQNEKMLNFSHSELTAPDGPELAKKFNEYGPLKKLRHLYLEHNALGDGCGALSQCLNRKNTPELKRVMLNNNRVTSAGVVALVENWGAPRMSSGVEEVTTESNKADDDRRSPSLDMLVLEDNRINDEGALALGEAVASGALKVYEIRLHGNPAITPAVRERLTSEEFRQQGHGTHFRFDKRETGSVFDQEGNVVKELSQDPRSKALDIS